MKNINVYCKKECGSVGGADFFQGKYYKCEKHGDVYYIFDNNKRLLKLSSDPTYKNFNNYFYTEKQLRQSKLKKLNAYKK